VYRILFGDKKADVHHRSKRSSPGQWTAMLSYLDQHKKSHDSHMTPKAKNNVPTHFGGVDLGNIKNIINKSISAHLNPKSVKNIASLINSSAHSIVASKVKAIINPDPSDIDPSKIKDIVDNVPFHIDPSYGDIFDHLGHGLVYDILRNNPQLLLDPEVQDVIGALYGFNRNKPPDPREVVDVLKVYSFPNHNWPFCHKFMNFEMF
jgi:hypothetical protein